MLVNKLINKIDIKIMKKKKMIKWLTMWRIICKFDIKGGFTNAKTIVYDQEDYMDDEEEEEVY